MPDDGLTGDFLFLDRIRGTEREAQHIVDQAHGSAETTLTSAQEEAQRLLDTVRAAADQERVDRLNAAVEAAALRLESARRQSEEEAAAILADASERLSRAIPVLADRIVEFRADR